MTETDADTNGPAQRRENIPALLPGSADPAGVAGHADPRPGPRRHGGHGTWIPTMEQYLRNPLTSPTGLPFQYGMTLVYVCKCTKTKVLALCIRILPSILTHHRKST